MSGSTDDTNDGFIPTELELRDHDEVSTWAERNPTKPVIPPKKNNTVKLTDAGKITARARTQQTQENKAQLAADIRKFKEDQARALQEIAEKHGRKLEYVQGRATTETGFKQTRAPNLHNAKLHFMAKEINEETEIGDKSKLLEIQRRMKEDPDMCDLSPSEEKKLLEDLLKQRELNAKGLRANHRAAAVDYDTTIGRLHEEMAKLHERTGATLFLVSARDSVNDTLVPTFGDAGNTSAFFIEHLDMTANEFIRKFQSWCDARRDDTKSKGSLLRVLQLECRCLISEGLNRLLKQKNILMAYENYESHIMVRHKVQLRGWPASLKFTSPHNLNTIAEVQRLRDALVSGACTWVNLSTDEHTAISEKVGEAPKKKRKPRKDKGTKKATTADVTEPESGAARPRKRAKRSAVAGQIPPGPKSASVISSSDESEGGREDEIVAAT